jgi:hypothetical protein
MEVVFGEVTSQPAPTHTHGDRSMVLANIVETILHSTFVQNVAHNLFKPLLLFFYAGFLIPILRVKFEFPKAIYQGLTIYLLLAIGWKGGEELAELPAVTMMQALGFMVVGFISNTIIGIVAYMILRTTTGLRKIDAATVSGYYGSDSAGTFVTCQGVLIGGGIAYAAYMPVMLAVMEIPGCLVALYLVSRLRAQGMDRDGNSPGEPGYAGAGKSSLNGMKRVLVTTHGEHDEEEELVTSTSQAHGSTVTRTKSGGGHIAGQAHSREEGENFEAKMSLEDNSEEGLAIPKKTGIDLEVLHEVFFNPGIYLLFAGIAIGFLAQLQGHKVHDADDTVFIGLFHGLLCLFLLEMGMTASQRLGDLRTAGWKFVAFGLLAPNLFATFGMFVAYAYSHAIGQPMEVGTYVLFAVLCGASSYIAVPAVQRLAIPEASPTLPLAASLGLTFSYNVTIGIPVYMEIAKVLAGTGA